MPEDINDRSWRERLAKHIAETGQSQRRISIEAGLGPGYVNSILNENKDPSIGNTMKICRAARLSLSKLLFGFEISPEMEKLLLDLDGDTARRDALFLLIRPCADR